MRLSLQVPPILPDPFMIVAHARLQNPIPVSANLFQPILFYHIVYFFAIRILSKQSERRYASRKAEDTRRDIVAKGPESPEKDVSVRALKLRPRTGSADPLF